MAEPNDRQKPRSGRIHDDADALVDTLTLLRSAERFGLRSARSDRIRTRLVSSASSPSERENWGKVLRRWLEKRRIEAFADPYVL